MNHQIITTDIDHSKTLKESGWSQEGQLFFWQENIDCSFFSHPSIGKPLLIGGLFASMQEPNCGCKKYSAPTAEELLSVMPPYICIKLSSFGREKTYIACTYPNHLHVPLHVIDFDKKQREHLTAANALVPWYCYLKEHDLLPKNI